MPQVNACLTTERLRFDLWKQKDANALYHLHADPRVQAGYPFGPDMWTREAIEQRLTGYIAEQERGGLTKWKLSLRDGTFIGRAGWSSWADGALELGYAISPEFQGRGYAVEASLSLVRWALATRPERLVGFALLSNSASRHILLRTGMIYEGDHLIRGAMHAFYAAIG